MVVLATRHQVCCIFWEQVAIFNKGISFHVDQNSLHWINFVKNAYNQVYVLCCKYVKKIAFKDFTMNDYKL